MWVFPSSCRVVYYVWVLKLKSCCRLGFTVEKVTSDNFEVSHSALRNSLMCLATAWNGSIHKLRVLAEGEDWSTLLKVCVKLCFECSLLEALFLGHPL